MPAVSKRQAAKMEMLYEQGKISKATRDEFLKGVDVSALPECVQKKKAKKGSRGK